MIDYQKLTGTQIAVLLALGLLVIGLAAFAPLVARWTPRYWVSFGASQWPWSSDDWRS